MQMSYLKQLKNAMPVAPLKLLVLNSAAELGNEINNYLVDFRSKENNVYINDPAFQGYAEKNYLFRFSTPRFNSGEGKAVLEETVRGKDLFILVDVCNHSLTYNMNGYTNHMSPDDHYQDLKRIIAAVGGKARRITVIMPFLYESRQSKRTSRESLDCALALQEMVNMGVDNIITFDAHDPRVQNAIPLHGFETIQPAYQFIKGLLSNVEGLQIDSDHMMVISPDEGGMGRAIYMANVLGLDVGMYYKRKDYTRVINGRNPVVAHEFLGSSVEGKDMIIIDDMISSGDSALEVAAALKARKANRIFICSTFGLFTAGLDRFDKAYEKGTFDRILTTNLIYQPPELLEREWYINCDLSKYIAYIIDTLNHDSSISDLLNPVERIHSIVSRYHANGKKNRTESP